MLGIKFLSFLFLSSLFAQKIDFPSQLKRKPFVDVQEFGARCDGSFNDTAYIQNAINSLPSTGGTVTIPPNSSCMINNIIFLKSNVTFRGWGDSSKLVNSGVAVTGPMLSGDFSSTSQGTNIHVSDLSLIGGDDTTVNSFQNGVRFNHIKDSSVERVNFSGFHEQTAASTQLIRFADRTINCVARANVLNMRTFSGSPTFYVIGIELDSPISGNFNGHVSGDPTGLANTVLRNTISDNKISGGVYGIQLVNVGFTNIIGNSVYNSYFRNLVLIFDVTSTTISGNSFNTAGSTNFICDYGVTDVQATGNTFSTVTGNENTNVELYYDVRKINIIGNIIRGASGGQNVLIGYTATDVTIADNTLYDYNVGVASILIQGSMPANYNTLINGTVGLKNIVISRNHIIATPTAASIRVQAFVTASVQGNIPIDQLTILDNDIHGGGIGIKITDNPNVSKITNLNALRNNFMGVSPASNQIVSDYAGVFEISSTFYPSANTWGRGSRVWNTEPETSGSTLGWVCITTGTPGTWVIMSQINSDLDALQAPNFQIISGGFAAPVGKGRLTTDGTGILLSSDVNDKDLTFATKTGGVGTLRWRIDGASGELYTPNGNLRIKQTSSFAGLGTPDRPTMVYCTNCSVTSPCTGSGSGAFAFFHGSTWKCPF